jgi:hypothetical protein
MLIRPSWVQHLKHLIPTHLLFFHTVVGVLSLRPRVAFLLPSLASAAPLGAGS